MTYAFNVRKVVHTSKKDDCRAPAAINSRLAKIRCVYAVRNHLTRNRNSESLKLFFFAWSGHATTMKPDCNILFVFSEFLSFEGVACRKGERLPFRVLCPFQRIKVTVIQYSKAIIVS